MAKASIGLQYLTYLDIHYHDFETGLGMKSMTVGELDLTTVDHWNLHGFSYYVLRCVRRLAEGPAGPYHSHSHREGVRSIHDFYDEVMSSDRYIHTSIIPDYFPSMNTDIKEQRGLEEFNKTGLHELCLQMLNYITKGGRSWTFR